MNPAQGLSWASNKRKSKTTALYAVIALIASVLVVGFTAAPVVADQGSAWSSTGWEDSSVLTGVDFQDYPGSMYSIGKSTGVRTAWSNDADGRGIDVAVIDTGVAPVTGLTGTGKVINGADLSFESQSDGLQYLDTYGHGTHMAGIIAGRDPGVPDVYASATKDHFVGIAPAARIVNVKVGSYNGAVDVSQVIAAIDWVIRHRDDNDMNIRVLNLSYGTDSAQSYLVDPLAAMVEKAWKAGIVVVVAAGNDGNAAPLRNPADDPYVISVGSAQYGDFNVSNSASVQYDRVSSFSNCGVGRTVDLVAPGKSITGLRVPGSYADDSYPHARVADRFFLGSGTSQAAAVVSGAAALVLSADKTLSPDQVKHLLVSNAKSISGVSTACQGAGVIHVGFLGSRMKGSNGATQTHVSSTGSGSIELSRGTDHLEMDGVELRGEQDIMGSPWTGYDGQPVTTCWTEGKGKNATTVCATTSQAVDTLWDGGDWNGASWSGASWSGASWSGASWSGASWSGASWSGASWSGASWSDKYWNGASWSGASWSGASWSGASWSGRNWTGLSWE